MKGTGEKNEWEREWVVGEKKRMSKQEWSEMLYC